ncbi:hypothetical protein FGU71_11460 [Erythrobacter insulae]|uniref:Uncharacterized protein n=1 Tax=Erythrobacter insulae TaxID=2584124 RepID=A0A547PE62_9SPHN|nr:hypothetical protein [Erythrobacter insulae]TRD12419.1 hypothetical protein FGU71_11460 [Erythrobacter insulae]
MISGSLIFGLLLIAGFSLGLALILDTQAPKMMWQRRALIASLGGAFIPMLLPIAVLLIEGDWQAETFILLMALIIGSLMLAGIVGFPVTYWFCKRREAARGNLDPAKDFE